MKSKTTAALLAFSFGWLGIHLFYTNHKAKGILCMLLWWTCIPALIAFIRGIVFLAQSPEAFYTYCEGENFIAAKNQILERTPDELDPKVL